jgi:hypothetical protein
MQGFSYGGAIALAGLALLAIALSILAAPLFGMVLIVVAILTFLVVRSLRGRRRQWDAGASRPTTEETAPEPEFVTPVRHGHVVEPTPDPEVDHRSAESFPASDPPATY